MYLSVAVGAGFNLMPMSLGFFGMCLECIGNAHHGHRDKYFTLGEKRFLTVLQNRLKRYKLNPTSRSFAKGFERVVRQDAELLHVLRNAFYGHSLMHLAKDRQEVTRAMRSLYRRYGLSARFTNISFQSRRIESDVTREGPALYKIGLRICRLFIFMMLGRTTRIPFATHDFQLIGDLREGERLLYPGGKVATTITSMSSTGRHANVAGRKSGNP
jgi:hypothetical protein